VIAHRLATVKDADNIVVIGKGGEKLEEGTHEELIARGGAYSLMVDAQSFDASPDVLKSPVGSKQSASSDNVEKDGSKVPKKSDQPASPDVAELPDERKPGIFNIIRRCLALSAPEAPFMVLGLLAAIISGVIVVGEAVIFGHIVQSLNHPSTTASPEFLCLMFFILAIIALFAYTASGSSFGILSEKLVSRVQVTSLKTVLAQDMEWFTGNSPDKLMTMLATDSGRMSGLSGVIIGTIVASVASVTGGLVVSLVVAWRIAVVLLAAVPVMLFAGYLRLRVLSKAEARQTTAYNDAAALASEACSAIRTVAALGREQDVLRLYKKALAGPYRDGIKLTLFGSFFLSFSLSITYFVYALAYWWGSKQVRNGHNSTLDFFIVLPALLFSAQAAGQMFSLAPEIVQAKAAAQNVFHYHDQTPTIVKDTLPSAKNSLSEDEKEMKASKGDLKSQAVLKGQLEFANVDLEYASRPGAMALINTSFKIEAGEFVAFVGPSGAGKSSTIALIERFYDPTSGVVLLDGHNIRSTPAQSHRERISLCPQEPDLFPGSVEYNIGLGAAPSRPATHDGIADVCKKIGLHEFVMSLPEGYMTEIGSAGNLLSGGQKQRIAIARALLRDPEILLLDEATSQLDAHSETQVSEAVMAAAASRTTIMVCHRLASVQRMGADRIFVFDQGQIIEQGNHDELMGLRGMYFGMVEAQKLGT